MPLLPGRSRKVINRNTDELIASGREPDQAYAIAMKNAGKGRKKGKKPLPGPRKRRKR